MRYKLTDGDIEFVGPGEDDLFTLHLVLKGFGGGQSLQSMLMTRLAAEYLHALLGQCLAKDKSE